MEKTKKQSSPVMGSTRNHEREHEHKEMIMPRIVQVGDVAYAQNKNNTRIIAAHYYDGLRESTDEVTFTYYGMSAIKITTPKGLELFFDPWKNPCDPSWGGIWYSMRMPMTHCDIGFTTHSHFDHNAFEVETQSEVFTQDVLHELYPFPNVDLKDRDNTIYLIETGGLRIVHWGDNRQNPPQDVWDRLQNIDVAILPVSDDGRTLTPEWADKIAKKMAKKMGAKIIIPTHYYFEGINIPNAGWGKSAVEYTKSHEHTMLDNHTITLDAKKVKDYNNHVFYFGENVPFEIEKVELSDDNKVAQIPEVEPVWEQYK